MIDFVGNVKKYIAVSLAILAVGGVCAFIFGVNLDIQFKGGAILTYSFSGELEKSAFEGAVSETLGQKITVQEQLNAATGAKNYVISLSAASGITPEQQLELHDKLAAAFPENKVESVSINVVDPTIGGEFLAKCLVAVGFAGVLMIVYIGLRFKRISGWSAGVVAVVALVHDILFVFITFIVFRISINDNFIAVVLTILGYSLNDTIVIYDRIRENRKIYGKKMSLGEVVNKSINQSLTRSITTTVTTVAAMVVVSIVSLLYNLDSMLSFSFPLIIGMVSGLYSSVCISGPLWVLWQEAKGREKKAA